MTGYSWRQERERQERERHRMRWHLVIIGVSIIILALALTLLWPAPAGGQAAAKMTITEFALRGEHWEIVSFPQGKVLGMALDGNGNPILAIMHEVGAPSQEWSVWLLWAGERWQDLGSDLLFVGQPFLYNGCLRYPFLRRMEQWQPAPGQSVSPTPGASRPEPRGPEPPFLEKP